MCWESHVVTGPLHDSATEERLQAVCQGLEGLLVHTELIKLLFLMCMACMWVSALVHMCGWTCLCCWLCTCKRACRDLGKISGIFVDQLLTLFIEAGLPVGFRACQCSFLASHVALGIPCLLEHAYGHTHVFTHIQQDDLRQIECQVYI